MCIKIKCFYKGSIVPNHSHQNSPSGLYSINTGANKQETIPLNRFHFFSLKLLSLFQYYKPFQKRFRIYNVIPSNVRVTCWYKKFLFIFRYHRTRSNYISNKTIHFKNTRKLCEVAFTVYLKMDPRFLNIIHINELEYPENHKFSTFTETFLK